MHHLQVELRNQALLVTMPGTTLRVVYRKPSCDRLVPRLDYFQREQKGPITRLQFLVRARKIADEKARELGWIV
jgi:hypothetical protein